MNRLRKFVEQGPNGERSGLAAYAMVRRTCRKRLPDLPGRRFPHSTPLMSSLKTRGLRKFFVTRSRTAALL
jgi:hypothetical protein